MVEGKAECWMVLLTMVHVIYRYLRNFRFEAETAYGFDILLAMVCQYLYGDYSGAYSDGLFIAESIYPAS